MHLVYLCAMIIIALVNSSFAVQCDSNPCELGGTFLPPAYQCLSLPNNLVDILCTCPDGQANLNRRCRVCDLVNCGPTGVCIEQQLFEGLSYACGCINGTDRYLSPGPCPDVSPITPPLTTTTTPTVPTICLNGGVYNPATGTCICPSGYTGIRCEIFNGADLCRDVTCANGGVCNIVPGIGNAVNVECWCLLGFSGEFCELIGTPGRCVSGLCQNGGVCEEKQIGISIYAYCRCPPGFNGRSCQTRYFSCPYTGIFADPSNCKHGKYFECTGATAVSRSCPKGLRYDFFKMQCALNVSCPP
jgi:hypothetical protein